MTITVSRQNDVTILHLKGKMLGGIDGLNFRQAIENALNRGEKSILVNMNYVTTIDSANISELISAYTATRNEGGKLKLCCLVDKTQDVLTITQLTAVFEIYESESEGIASF